MSIVDKLINAGSTFDWITPTSAMVQDAAHGGSYTFLFPDDAGWSGREIIRLLRRNGIKTWGEMVVNDTIMISVPKEQAERAQHILNRTGVSQENPKNGETREPGCDLMIVPLFIAMVAAIKLIM